MDYDWKDRYKKKLYNVNISMKDLSIFVNKHLPKYLYKYRRFNSYWKDTLFEGLLFFADSLSINDPFDCHMYIDTKKYIDFMNDFASKYVFPDTSLSKIEKIYNTRISDNLNRMYNEIRKDTLLTCFSEEVNSILMWSHYADSHKGFCIEYDTEKIDMEYRRFLYPVIYQKEVYDYTDIAIMRDESYIKYMNIFKILGVKTNYELKDVINNIWIPMLIKAEEWKYEKEWRIVVPSAIFGLNEHLINFGDAINSVYLGVWCDENSIEAKEIIKWAKNMNTKVYKMEREPGKYNIISKVIFNGR